MKSKSLTNFSRFEKLTGTLRGVLKAAEADSSNFPQLQMSDQNSTDTVEVYGVKSSGLDKAMERVRKSSDDVEWCAHVYHAAGDRKGVLVPEDTIYVELKSNLSSKAVNELLSTHGLELVREEPDNSNAMTLRLTSASTENPIKIASKPLQSKAVSLAEPAMAVAISLKVHRPTDNLFPNQWHLENRGGFGLTAGADVSAPEAWDITRGDSSVVVCVMDDGVDTDYRDFCSDGKIVAERDFGQGDFNADPVTIGRGSRGDNHGTACAGVAVADENGIGTVGVAPKCSLIPIRTSGMISNSSIKSLFDFARENGADVISCSWGVATRTRRPRR